MSKTAISVILPTYCPQDYLWKCLDSLDSQTFPRERFEILLILNGPLSPYEARIKSYLAEHPKLPLRLLTTETSGVSHARNWGLDVAQGRYIAFVDDDDFLSPSYLEELYWTALACQGISLCYPFAFEDGKEELQLPYEMTTVYDKLSSRGVQDFRASRKFFGGPCMKLIPREVIRDRRFDPRFSNGEDSLFMFLISDQIKKVQYTSKEAVYYRRFRVGSATTRRAGKSYYVRNATRQMRAYTRIYFSAPSAYSFSFFLTRLLGALRGMLYHLAGKENC